MGKIAFVFSGQGDQFPGMGKDMATQYPIADEVFKMCDRLRPGTAKQCFEGTEDELKETKNTQPCLFAQELAAASVLIEEGIKPDSVAGFSLGEVVACTVAGVVDNETGFSIVCKRGECMQQAAEKHDTSMVAVVKLTQEQVEEVCQRFSEVYPVNFNCPGQITVSGLSEQMPEFMAAVKEIGGRAIPVKVKGAFHSPFMNEATAAFKKVLENVEFKQSKIKLYSNVTAEPYAGEVEDMKELLANQICNPVRWEKIIRNMIADGVDTFIEIGPGNTLTNIIGKIDTEVKRYSVSELPVILEEVKPC